MRHTKKCPKKFRKALGQFATGVTVVTTLDNQGNKIGITVNSFSSVSLDPMLVLWSIAKTTASFDVFSQTNHFAIHILSADQQHLSDLFSSNTADRFKNIDWVTGHGGVPLISNASAVFQCDTEARHEGGDHLIIVGRVVDFSQQQEKAPLIFHAGRYVDLLSIAV